MNCDAKHKTRTRASCALAKGHSSYHQWRPRGVECEHVEVAPGNLPECRACGCIVWPGPATPSSWPVRGEAVRLLIKHEWVEQDETRDRCIECGGTKPDPDDRLPMGHVKGCALAALLCAAGVQGVLVSGQKGSAEHPAGTDWSKHAKVNCPVRGCPFCPATPSSGKAGGT